MSTSQPTGKSVYRDLASALGPAALAVDVEAAVTATAGLLDIGSPTIVVDDGTAAVAVTLPSARGAPASACAFTCRQGRQMGGRPHHPGLAGGGGG
jgi:hypothetical protein